MNDATKLPLRKLGRTGLDVAGVSLGAPHVGADTALDAPISDAAISTVVAMLQSPFRLVDTSNSYGRGRSEATIGKGIAALGGLPEGRVVATKADRDLDTLELTASRVRRSFEESSARLGLDYFPIYHLHDPYSVTFQEAMARGGAVEGLIRLKEEGLVGSLGIAAGPLSLLADYLSTDIFDVVLTHNRYTLLDRSAESLIASAAERGIGVFNGAPFGGGILAKGAAAGATYAYEPVSADALGWLTRLEALCTEWELSLPTVALHFSLRNPNISSTFVGTANQTRIAGIRAMMDVVIPEEFWDQLERLGTPPLASSAVAE